MEELKAWKHHVLLSSSALNALYNSRVRLFERSLDTVYGEGVTLAELESLEQTMIIKAQATRRIKASIDKYQGMVQSVVDGAKSRASNKRKPALELFWQSFQDSVRLVDDCHAQLAFNPLCGGTHEPIPNHDAATSLLDLMEQFPLLAEDYLQASL